MIDELVIRTEEEAHQALSKALAAEISDTAQVVFDGWPVFRLTISGQDFNGSIPTRIMPPILELQSEIHRIYCRAKYNTEDTRRLRQEERELLELVVIIRPGSTEFIATLADALNEIIKNANMSGKEIVTLLVAISFLVAGTVGWKDWLRAREREHNQEVTVRLSQEETKRLELVTEAIRQRPELEHNKRAIDEFKSDLSKKLKPSDQLAMNGEPVITGVRAAEIVPAPRVSAEDVRIDGEFVIKQVIFPRVFGEKYRFVVARVIDGQQMTVDALPGVLTAEQINVLKEGGFAVRTVLMEINAKSLRGNISSANLVSIRWPADE